MKNIQKTSGTRKKYKPGQLITIDNYKYRWNTFIPSVSGKSYANKIKS